MNKNISQNQNYLSPEADAHDQVDERHPVQVDPPPGHVAQDTGHDAHDREGHPERAQRVRDHDEAHQHHEACRHQHRLDSLGLDLQVLVNEDEEGMKHSNLKLNELDRKQVAVSLESSSTKDT